MRIRMLVVMPEGAARNGEPWPAQGETFVVPAADGAHFVASGIAEEVDDPDDQDGPVPEPDPDPEHATVAEVPEQRARRRRSAEPDEEG
ncbi:hypothetical protein ACFWN1_05840 [Streptomyces sp. NPDC058459]|uniref:hypothetical protein n=1 Tax=Streptomyces sp. NPDC058459 TaxID=3346508 RepID=UPI00365ED46B